MQEQLSKQTTEKQGADISAEAQAFNAVKNEPVTRTVKLVFSSCCGCGCHDITVEREVDSSSKLQDYDRINADDVLDTDTWV